MVVPFRTKARPMYNSQTIPLRYMANQLQPFLVRLRADTRQLLDKAAQDQRRSRASIIDEALREQLQPRYGQLEPRLQRFLMGAKQ